MKKVLEKGIELMYYNREPGNRRKTGKEEREERNMLYRVLDFYEELRGECIYYGESFAEALEAVEEREADTDGECDCEIEERRNGRWISAIHE